MLQKLQTILTQGTFYPVYFLGIVGLSFRQFHSVILFSVLFGFACAVDVILGWYLAIIGKRNTSRDLKQGIILKCMEAIIVLFLVIMGGHVTALVDDAFFKFLCGLLTLVVPIGFFIGELQSILENTILLRGKKKGMLVMTAKTLGMLTKFLDDKVEEKIQRNIHKKAR